MKDEDLSQSALSVRTKGRVGQGLISGYLNEDRLPEEAMLTYLVLAFPVESGNALLVAWLRDHVPDELTGRVRIEGVNGSARVMDAPACPPGYERLPRRVRTLVDEVVNRCEGDPKFLRAIESTVSLTRP